MRPYMELTKDGDAGELVMTVDRVKMINLYISQLFTVFRCVYEYHRSKG